MSVGDFFLPDTRQRVGQAVAAIESGTAAEVVVTVRKFSGQYRHTDLVVGGGLALVTLVFLLFDPEPYDVAWIPLNVVSALLLGAIVSANVEGFRRAFTPSTVRSGNALVAAKAAFYDLGVSRTTGRTGVLVYVSLFERRVEVIGDVAIDVKAMGPEWTAALVSLQSAIDAGVDLARFLEGLAALAAPLARTLPAQPNDVNELPNEPVMA